MKVKLFTNDPRIVSNIERGIDFGKILPWGEMDFSAAKAAYPELATALDTASKAVSSAAKDAPLASFAVSIETRFCFENERREPFVQVQISSSEFEEIWACTPEWGWVCQGSEGEGALLHF